MLTDNPESFFRNALYKSLTPTQRMKDSSRNMNKLRHSIINIPKNQNMDTVDTNQIKNNSKAYKYERVGNIFKLIEVKSNNSDPKQQVIHQTDRLERIDQLIQDLTNRVISLELQQAKIPAIQRKINQKANLFAEIESQCGYMSNRLTSVSRQIKEVKQRLEEIEQIGNVQNKRFIEMTKLKIKKFNYEQTVQKLKNQISHDLLNIKSQLIKSFNLQKKSTNKQQKKSKNDKDDENDKDSRQTLTSSSSVQFRQKKLKLRYRECYETQGAIYSINQIDYVIDKNGKLFDSYGYALLDTNNKEIRLDQSHLKKLVDFGILI